MTCWGLADTSSEINQRSPGIQGIHPLKNRDYSQYSSDAGSPNALQVTHKVGEETQPATQPIQYNTIHILFASSTHKNIHLLHM